MKHAARWLLFLSLTSTASMLWPVSTFALSVDRANYDPSAPVYVTCGITKHNYEVYDITAGIDGGAGNGGDLGLHNCSSDQVLTFASVNAHTYSILEIESSASCAGQDYAECAIEEPTWSEINFTVGTGATPGSVGHSSFVLSTNKRTYAPRESITVMCGYQRGNFELFDVTAGISGVTAKGGNLGLYECSNATISPPTIAEHTYAIIELPYGDTCESEDYDDCSSENFSRDEIDFSVGAETGSDSPPASTPGMSKDTYSPDETPQMTCSVESDELAVYDITSGVDGLIDNGGFVGQERCGNPTALSFDLQPAHSYAVVELSNGASCAADDYSACQQEGFSRNTYYFSISARLAARRVISYPPLVQILSPKSGSVFSKTASIQYSATDQNDIDAPEIKADLGLGDKPVSIYYSDKISEWDHSYVSPDDKTLIANNLSATGTYAWDTSGLTPGVAYRVIVDALDQSNTLGEYVSDPFYVDFTPPQFIVSANPSVTRGEDVAIIVEPNEKLKDAPKINVTQSGGSAIPVEMTLKDDVYQGIYKVLKSEDGIAHISVQGKDLAGNIGTTTLSGGTFAVGVNPPPAPHVLTPKSGTISTSTISMTGTTRPDTTIIVTINGIDTYAATTSKDGSFSVSNIRLSASVNRGLNTLSVVAKDKTDALSAPATLQIKYNVAPTITIISPAKDATVRGITALIASSTDENNDPLAYTYQIIAAKDFDPALSATSSKNRWTTIAESISSNKFSWDTTEVDDGTYLFRVIVNDGIAKAYSQPRQITAHNTLPYFRFQDGRKSISRQAPVTVVGKVLEPATLAGASIASVEYSVDSGHTWQPVQIQAGSASANFSVTFTDLKNEGTYGVLWHVKDSRGLLGRASHPVVIDATAPSLPVITSPHKTLITDEDDEDSLTPGVQFSVSVSAEPESEVTLSFNGATSSARADLDGSAVFHGLTASSRGSQTISVTARDAVGNTSAAASRVYIYDNPPEVSFLTPKPSRGLQGKAEVSWRTSDLDGDVTHTSLYYRKGDSELIALAKDPAENSFAWDVSSFPEGGDYELRLVASDGFATTSQTIGFFIDKTPPALDSFKLDHEALGAHTRLTGKGTASDALSGIEYIEYAVTPVQEKNAPTEWYTALITRGYLKKQAAFAIKNPLTLPDGQYEIHVRAVDAAGNPSDESVKEFSVDATAPRVGSFLASVESVQISPDKDGVLDLYADSDFTLAVSLEDDTASSSVIFAGKSYQLVHDVASGLWEVHLHTMSEGEASIRISAEDRLGNSLSNVLLGKVSALSPGKIVVDGKDVPQHFNDAEIKVLSLNKETGRFVEIARPSGELGVHIQDDGTYNLALPAGEYRLVFSAPGYLTVEEDVTFERPTLVSEIFTTKKISALQEVMQNILGYLHSI